MSKVAALCLLSGSVILDSAVLSSKFWTSVEQLGDVEGSEHTDNFEAARALHGLQVAHDLRVVASSSGHNPSAARGEWHRSRKFRPVFNLTPEL